MLAGWHFGIIFESQRFDDRIYLKTFLQHNTDDTKKMMNRLLFLVSTTTLSITSWTLLGGTRADETPWRRRPDPHGVDKRQSGTKTKLVEQTPLTAAARRNLTRRQEQRRTNILLITADDLNWDSVGSYGCPVQDITPNIDRLASQGIQFDYGYVNIAICTPSRQVMLSGLHR